LKVYEKGNVYEAALDRIRWLFDEFPNVVCTYSGGKDSTVCFNLSLQVAREKNRLPLQVMFLDQEAEWQSTVDQVRRVMYHPDVKPFWYQVPFVLFNATSTTDHWLNCWDPDREADWIHPKDPISIKENIYGQTRFTKMFGAVAAVDHAGKKTAYIGGVRTEESPARFAGLTYDATYKWVTWGRLNNKVGPMFTFYPIYDWSYLDVWKAIHEHGWEYSKLYDAMYQYGVPVLKMRVSNVHHETAVASLFMMQEIEPETHNRVVARLSGIDMASKMGKADYQPTQLPFMFSDWREYRDYLLDHLIENPDWKVRFTTMFARHDRAFGEELGESKYKGHVHAILVNDWEGVTLGNMLNTNLGIQRRRKKERDAEQELI